ncbi:MAG: hypothetical protein ACR2IE_06350 [Candidatus Sumerlaeaceae bacterium]
MIDVLSNCSEKYQEDSPGTDESRIRIGQTEAGRYLKVVYTPLRSGDGLFVITAYELVGKALTAFRRRRKKKGR